MEDVLRLLLIFGLPTVAALSFSPIGRALAARIHGRPGGGASDERLRRMVEAQERGLEEIEQVRRDVVELQERLDFAERMLAREREAPRLPADGGER